MSTEQQDQLAEIKAMAEGMRRRNRLVAEGDPRKVLGDHLDWLIAEVEQLRAERTDDADGGMARSAMNLALADARKNCREHYAIATVTLRSGVQIDGRIEGMEPAFPIEETVHMKTDHGGWATLLSSEVVAVQVRRP